VISDLKTELDACCFWKKLFGKINPGNFGSLAKILILVFFIYPLLIKRRRNSVDFLKLPTGAWLSERVDIGNSFVDHFANLFTSSNPPISPDMLDLFDQVITLDDNTSICTTPSEAEIFEALSSIGSNKAPGPDGFSALFYKEYWNIVKDVVLTVFGIFLNLIIF
jgi:hypothetical protein